MGKYLLAALVFSVVVAMPVSATDTSSLSAFLSTCSSDAKGCKAFTHDAVMSAKNANYGCVPRALSTEDAGGQLLDWLKGPASGNPKFEKMSLDDVMWEGVDALWPCKAK